MSIEISELRPDDCAEVVELTRSTDRIKLEAGDSVEAYVRRYWGLSLVARDGDKIVGVILCGLEGKNGYVQQLAVVEDCREQGIEKMLLDKALQKLGARGVHKCRLTLQGDDDAGGFWASLRWPDNVEAAVPSQQGDSEAPSADDRNNANDTEVQEDAA